MCLAKELGLPTLPLVGSGLFIWLVQRGVVCREVLAGTETPGGGGLVEGRGVGGGGGGGGHGVLYLAVHCHCQHGFSFKTRSSKSHLMFSSLWGAESEGSVHSTLQASPSGTILQTLLELVTPWKRLSLSPHSCPPMLSVPYERLLACKAKTMATLQVFLLRTLTVARWMSGMPDVWNLRAVVWFPFPVSSLVFLPRPLAPSVLPFFCKWSFLLTFFSPENSRYFSLRVRLFCVALVEQLGDDSW